MKQVGTFWLSVLCMPSQLAASSLSKPKSGYILHVKTILLYLEPSYNTLGELYYAKTILTKLKKKSIFSVTKQIYI